MQLFLQPRISVNNYEPAHFGSGTRLTVLGEKIYETFEIDAFSIA